MKSIHKARFFPQTLPPAGATSSLPSDYTKMGVIKVELINGDEMKQVNERISLHIKLNDQDVNVTVAVTWDTRPRRYPIPNRLSLGRCKPEEVKTGGLLLRFAETPTMNVSRVVCGGTGKVTNFVGRQVTSDSIRLEFSVQLPRDLGVWRSTLEIFIKGQDVPMVIPISALIANDP